MQNWSKNRRKPKIRKLAATVDWIGSDTGLIWAVASGSRLERGDSRLDQSVTNSTQPSTRSSLAQRTPCGVNSAQHVETVDCMVEFKNSA